MFLPWWRQRVSRNKQTAKRRSHRPKSCRLLLEALEDRSLPSASSLEALQAAVLDVQGRTPGRKDGPLVKVGLDLATCFEENRVTQANTQRSWSAPGDTMLQVAGGRVLVNAIASSSTPRLVADLKALGMHVTATAGRVVSGWLPMSAIPAAAHLGSLNFARAAYRPMTSAGLVTDQGDHATGADLIHNAAYDGTGVTVGVMSDSYDNSGSLYTIHAADDIASGDLPAAGVNVLEEDPSAGTDEGRAMLQIVHHLAPGASLAFHTAFNGDADFAQGILDLADPSKGNANVIVDDVLSFDEPMFQDGIIAQAVDQVVASGHAYFSAALNFARQAYEAPFKDSGITYNDGDFASVAGAPHFKGGTAHDFGGSVFQDVSVPAGGGIGIDLQWNSDYASAGPGNAGSNNDLDIYLIDPSTNQVIAGSTNNNIGGDPTEIFGYVNPSSTQAANLQLLIVNNAGPNPTEMKYVWFQVAPTGTRLPLGAPTDYLTNSPTVFGHPAAAGAVAVGAAYYQNTPAVGVNPAVAEGFSSSGPTHIYFDASGSPVDDVRQKPEVVAPDGADTTFFGGDSDGSGFPNFFGTSAAAPHAAAIAAQMVQANPFLTPLPDQVHSRRDRLADGVFGARRHHRLRPGPGHPGRPGGRNLGAALSVCHRRDAARRATRRYLL
jgi:hypothetical protein